MPLTTTTASVDLSDVREPARNPNHMSADDFESLRLVIREKGFFQPPLLRRAPLTDANGKTTTWEIVDGVHRVRASLLEGLDRLDCVCTDMDARTARVLQVTMNRLRGELNLTAVAETVRELVEADIPIPELALMGYREDELKAMLDATRGVDEEEVLASSGGVFDDVDDEKPTPKPYILELTFSTSAELRKVKRTLKKAGSGDHAAGLLRLIEGA